MHDRTVLDKEVVNGSFKASSNNLHRDVMATLSDPISNARKRKPGTREPEEEQVHGITTLSQFAEQRYVRTTGKSGFESEISAAVCQPLNFFEHEPASAERGSIG